MDESQHSNENQEMLAEKSHPGSENHKKSAENNHQKNETRHLVADQTHILDASRNVDETQKSNAKDSHSKNENHAHNAGMSHAPSENHIKNASRSDSETHKANASQTANENQSVYAENSRIKNENRLLSASHSKRENQTDSAEASHQTDENQGSCAEKPDLEHMSGEELADLNAAKTAIQCYYDLQKPRVMQLLRLGARKRLREKGLLPLEKLPIDDRLEKAYQHLLDAEKELGSSLVFESEKVPVWNAWLKHVKGIGPVLGACFIGLIQDAKKYPTVSKLWTYAGEGLKDGQIQRKKTGEKINWNPLLKTTCWKASGSFVKYKCYYRKRYDQFKSEDRAKHPEKTPKLDKDGKQLKGRNGQALYNYSDGHIHNRAMRKTAKLFLAHLWEAWHVADGVKPPTDPYAFERLEGHRDFFDYREAMEK